MGLMQFTDSGRPVESHSGARGNILAGPPNIFMRFLKVPSRDELPRNGPSSASLPSAYAKSSFSGEEVFEFFFSKWYILAYFINFWPTARPQTSRGPG